MISTDGDSQLTLRAELKPNSSLRGAQSVAVVRMRRLPPQPLQAAPATGLVVLVAAPTHLYLLHLTRVEEYCYRYDTDSD